MRTRPNFCPMCGLIGVIKTALRRTKRLICRFTLRPTQRVDAIERTKLQPILHDIAQRPLDHRAHFKLAQHYFAIARFIPAIAVCRTSLALGSESPEVYRLLAKAYFSAGCGSLGENLVVRGLLPADYFTSLAKEYSTDTGSLTNLPPFTYQRLKAVEARIRQAVPDEPVRILDVGGGDGALCLFMPNAQYVLAEPTINGITGQSDVFPEKSFDIVVACHVLEHIPEVEKDNFLDVLCSLAKNRVILVGPMDDHGITAQMDSLIYRITFASWAGEHLDCKLPTLDMVRKFARKRGLSCKVTANGDRAAVFWMVFALHYANIAGKTNELDEIVQFSNRYLNDHISNPNQPNDYFVELYIDKAVNSNIPPEH